METADDDDDRREYSRKPIELKVEYKRLNAFFDRHSEPQWNLWKGGRSKAGLITGRFFGIGNAKYGQDSPPPEVRTQTLPRRHQH